MAARKTDTFEFEFEYKGKTFEASRSELESYETNKQLAVGGNEFYLAVERVFLGRDVEYAKMVGGTYDDIVALTNAAFAAYPKAKN